MRFLREGRSIAGNSKSATEQAPNTRAEIMPEAYKSLSAEENAAAHAAKHAGEFPELPPGEYVQSAQKFVQNPPQGVLTKVRPNGDTLLYDPATNTFAVRAANGAPRTMFRPTDGINYWNKQ
jgi:filamentous hemagglutinin